MSGQKCKAQLYKNDKCKLAKAKNEENIEHAHIKHRTPGVAILTERKTKIFQDKED